MIGDDVTTTRRTMTVPEAAALLGISKGQGYMAARTGAIPTIKIGKRILVPLAALERMLQGSA
jgi:excisionase family DNA binding protein